MTPGQLVVDRRLGKVVEITARASEDLYWVRPLGRQHISTLMVVRAMWLREVSHERAPRPTWIDVLAVSGWLPDDMRSKAI